MSDEPHKRVRRGPVAVLFLLVGLLLGSAGGVTLSLETEGSTSQLRQARSAKGTIALRAAPRETYAEADDAGDPLVFGPLPGVVSDTALRHPASAGGLPRALRERSTLLGYRARAPPAA